MNAWYDFGLAWFADYYLLATLLLMWMLAATVFVKQPARRLAIAWATAGALLLLAVLAALPGWSVVHVLGSSPPRPALPPPVVAAPFASDATPARTAGDMDRFSENPVEAMHLPETSAQPAPSATVAEVTDVHLSPYVLLPLAAGSLVTLVWLALGAWQTQHLLRASSPAPAEVNSLLAALSTNGRQPALRLSPAVATGVALGLRRPTILLPQSYADRCDALSLRAVLAHELAHLHGGDLWLLAILRLLMVPLWAHPLFWLVRRRVRLDQETLADAAAAELTSRATYAEQLVAWARDLSTVRPPTLAGAVGLWETRSQLRKRIAVLLDERLTILRNCSRRWKFSAMALCAAAAVALSLVTVEPRESAAEETGEPTASASPDREANADAKNSGKLHELPHELPPHESLFYAVPVTTALQRKLLGGDDIVAYLNINARELLAPEDDDSDPLDEKLTAIREQLTRLIKEQPVGALRVKVDFGTLRLPDGDSNELIDVLREMGTDVGFGKTVAWGSFSNDDEYEWKPFTDDEATRDGEEEAIDAGNARVFPVTTPLSKWLSGGVDCVIDIADEVPLDAQGLLPRDDLKRIEESTDELELPATPTASVTARIEEPDGAYNVHELPQMKRDSALQRSMVDALFDQGFAEVHLQLQVGVSSMNFVYTQRVQESSIPASIRVRVLNSNGDPAVGAKVHWSIWADGPPRGNGDLTADENGEVVVQLPPSLSILRLWAGVEGHVSEFVQLYMRHDSKEMAAFDYTEPLPDVFTFTLEPGAEIGGSVVNEDGNPIAGATVEARVDGSEHVDGQPRPSLWWEVDNTAVSDEQGRWTLNRVPANESTDFRLKLMHPDYIDDMQWAGLQKQQGVTNEQLRDKSATIVMHKGVEVTGTVVDPDGNPIEGAIVVWGDDPYYQPGSQEVVTDASGKYRLPQLPGLMNLTVIAEGWAPQMRTVDLGADSSSDFELHPGHPLRIRFVDTAGNPIPNVGVLIEEWRDSKSLYNRRHPNVVNTNIPARADENGLYEWTWAPELPITLSFFAEGYHELREKPFRASEERTYVVKLRREDEPNVEDPVLDEVDDADERSEIAEDSVSKAPDVQTPQIHFTIVIAKNMMLLDGREFITWAEIEDKIAALENPRDARLHYYVTRAARETGQEDFMNVEHRRLTEKYGLQGMSIGSLWPRTDFRYDRLETAADLVPNPAHAVTGQIVNGDGQAVAGAEVLLIEPVDESITYKSYHLTLVGGRIRNPVDHVLTVTDQSGAFTVYPSSEDGKYYLLAVHPGVGFAMVRQQGRKGVEPIQLQPWASVTGKFLPQEEYEQSASISTGVRAEDGWPEISISQHSEEQPKQLPDGQFEFSSVPPNLPSVFQRMIKQPEGVRLGLPARELELDFGESLTLEIGDLSKLEKQHLDLHERFQRMRDEAQPVEGEE